MNSIDYFRSQFDRGKQVTMRAIDSLTSHELAWRPGPECNSIGMILYHVARWEDASIQTRIQGKTQIWETGKWYQKLNLPMSDSGAHYTPEQIAHFPTLDRDNLLGYAEAVRAQTLEYLNNATAEELGRIIDLPRQGNTAVGTIIANSVVHLAQHAGEIGYLRGIQRGLDK